MATATPVAKGEQHIATWRALLEPPHALPATVVVLAILSPAFGFFITATVLPSVIAEIGGLALYAWASTAYAVASILGTAGSSVVVRKTGMRATLVIAAVAFVTGTGVCAVAPSMLVLIAGRGLQGLGAGMMIAGVHTMLREVFPEALWSRLLAAMSAAWGAAAMAGPAVGGIFAGLDFWRGAFWSMVPLPLVAAAMTWRILPRAAAPEASASRVPLGRLGLICAGVLCVASVGNVGSIAARVALVGAAIAAIALTLRLDAAAVDRLFPSDMLSLSAPVGKGFWMILFLAISTTPGSVYIPLFLQLLHGVSPATAGYFYAAQSLAWTAASLVSARLVGDQVRVALVLGPLMIATGFAGLFATLASGPVAVVAMFIVLVGCGIGTCWAHVCSIVLGSAREGEGALTASLLPTTQTFAVALGAALSGIIANAAGLSSGASRPVAALASAWLFGVFLVWPLAASVIASRISARRAGGGRAL